MYCLFSSPSPLADDEEAYIAVGQRYIISERSLLSVVATDVKISIASKVLSGIDARDRCEDVVDLLRKGEGGNASHVSALSRIDEPTTKSSLDSFDIGEHW